MLLGASVAGCISKASEDPLGQAETLCKEAKWEEAIPLLKRHLLLHPRGDGRNAAAHFYLGQCYLFSKEPIWGAAEGEFRVAVDVFKANGKKSPIEDFPDGYFELRCYLEIAKVRLKRLQVITMAGAPPQAVRSLLDECRKAADEARAVDPESPDVKQLDSMLDDLGKP